MNTLQQTYLNCIQDLKEWNAPAEIKTIYTVQGNLVTVSQFTFKSTFKLEDFEAQINKNVWFTEELEDSYYLPSRYTVKEVK